MAEPELDPEVVSSAVSKALDDADIPSVLWGPCLLAAHKIPVAITSVDFVVDDDNMDMAAAILDNMRRLSVCRDPDCPRAFRPRPSPVPAVHAHFHASDLTVGLYNHIDTLSWVVPKLRHCDTYSKRRWRKLFFTIAPRTSAMHPANQGAGFDAMEPGGWPVVGLRAKYLAEFLEHVCSRESCREGNTMSDTLKAQLDICLTYVGHQDQVTRLGPGLVELIGTLNYDTSEGTVYTLNPRRSRRR